MISNKIRQRIIESQSPFHANDNIAEFIKDGEIDLLQDELEDKIKAVLDCLIIDRENDHNTQGTAKRVAKMYLKEIFKGRYQSMPPITDFPNAKDLDQIYTIGPITVRSSCSHHLVPIVGKAWIGVLPSDRVIGISKFVRLCEWVMARPQIQEESTVQLADIIEKMIKPKALAVVVEATHLCMTHRGVKETDVAMTTSVMRGAFRENASARAEFFKLIGK
jgi:GTP cyclohydrolase I